MVPQQAQAKAVGIPPSAREDVLKFFEWDNSMLQLVESSINESEESERISSSSEEEEILVQFETQQKP